MVALWLLPMVPAVALKVAVVAAAATDTDPGTVRIELVLVRVTLAPPAGAAALNVTVQVEFAPELRLAGEHCKPDTVGRAVWTAIVPLVPETGNPVPSARDAIRLPSVRGNDGPLPADSVTVTTATTPLLIAFAFIPEATHIAEPLAMLQLKVFPAAVKAGPAAKLTAVTFAGA